MNRFAKYFVVVICLFGLEIIHPSQIYGLGKPSPPFDIASPPAPPNEFNEQDLSEFDYPSLADAAYSVAEEEDYKQAIQFQYWAVQNSQGEGFTDLASCYSANLDIEGAAYYFQKAAIEEGVDPDWANRGPELFNLRNDKMRWQKLSTYLDDCIEYWAQSGHRREVVTLPTGYKLGTPIPILVGLHGLGSKPEDFAGDEVEQELADRLGIAFVSISATIPRSPNSFEWTEDIQQDTQHVLDGLKRVESRVTAKRGALVFVGFSQGAQLAVEIAARDPEQFAGAISLCPGFMNGIKIDEAKVSPKISSCKFVVISGGDEGLGNKLIAKRDVKWLRNAGSQVVEHTYEGMGHSFPPNFYDNLSLWLQFMIGVQPAEVNLLSFP